MIPGEGRKKIIQIATIGILATGILTTAAASLPIVTVSTGVNQELRVMPPTEFPLTMQQYRDYDTHQFNYRIVLGWPDGFPIYESMLIDDQSEFIHITHIVAAAFLGIYQFTSLMVIIGLIYILESQKGK